MSLAGADIAEAKGDLPPLSLLHLPTLPVPLPRMTPGFLSSRANVWTHYKVTPIFNYGGVIYGARRLQTLEWINEKMTVWKHVIS